MNKKIVLVGYGGHAFVAADILLATGFDIIGYCDNVEKEFNPFNLNYLGSEKDFFAKESNATLYGAFVAIGDNYLRRIITESLVALNVSIVNAIHPKAIISSHVKLGIGIFVAAKVVVNACSAIGDGVICNTSSSIDHECTIGNFTHVAPGVILCGNVAIGNHCLIGANTTIIPGKKISNDIIIGAGSVVISNIENKGIYSGSPIKL